MKKELSNTALLILSLLKDTDKYGYQMISDLAILSSHMFELKEGTLYPILHGLEKDGAVKSYQKQAETGKMRKYYHLTPRGIKVLQEKTEEWKQYSTAVDHVVGIVRQFGSCKIDSF